MDEHTLAREFDRVVRGEPPLGFDPDDVVTRAGRRQRRRRATITAGGGVAAIAIAAIAVPLAIGHGGGARVEAAATATSAPATHPSAQWPPNTLTFPTISQGPLTDDLAAGKRHLLSILSTAVPGATAGTYGPPDKPGMLDGFVGQFGSAPVTTKDPKTGVDHITDGVTRQGYSTPPLTFTEGGRTLNVDITVQVPVGTVHPGPVRTGCDGLGTCVVTPEPDGSVRVVEHAVFAGKPGATPPANGRRQEWLSVTVFRPDGTVVGAESEIQPGAPAADVLPTENELLRLAGDPGFKLTP